MTNSQKKALRYWVLGVVVITRLWFFIPQYLPNLVPEVLHNSGWIDIYIHIDSQSVHLNITHQFVDPLILGLITFLVGVILYIPGDRMARPITILWAPAFFGLVAWVFLYQQNGNDLLFQFLDSVGTLSTFFSWCVLGVASYSILYFFILGVKSRFNSDVHS